MNWKRWTMMLSLILLLIGSINAQNVPQTVPNPEDIPKVEFVRKTPDGAIIVRVGQTQFRLLTADEYRQALIDREKVKVYEQIEAEDRTKLAEIERQRNEEIRNLTADYERQLSNLRRQLDITQSLYEKEIEKSKKKDKLGAVSVLSSPITRIIVDTVLLILRIFK